MDLDQLCRAVSSPAALKNLPGYVEKVNPALIGLRRVIWPYSFRSEIHCALTNCGARHKSGVMIELEDGTVSNIGHICGADADKYSTKFSEEMLKMSASRLREAMLPLLLDRVALQKIEQQARAAYHAGEQWLRRRLAFSALFPDAAKEVERRYSSGSSMRVVDIVERGAAEISELIASGQFRNRAEARYKEIDKGAIRGASVMSLSEPRISSLWRRADALLAADPLALEIAALQRLFTEANQLPHDALQVMKACEAAQGFFAPENCKLMAMLPMPQTAKDALMELTLGRLDGYATRRPQKNTVDERLARPISKKQRDLQKRLEATLREAKRFAK
ncbi:hypothetical protein [Paraburkholderia phenoliruptrix]|uniref:hypothetical protein n=1 Tax=Paraburkholderia phenoliruptrix TaxID=252970 RepID=UPI003D97E2C9